MPPPADPRKTSICVWILSFLLFGFIIAGCICLVLFILGSSFDYAVLGLVLIGIPWLFWLFTYMYRCVSRSLNLRPGFGGGGAASIDRRGLGPSSGVSAPSRKGGNDSSQLESPGSAARRVHFADEIVVDEQKGGSQKLVPDDTQKNSAPRSGSFSSSNNNDYDDISSSPESERPLAMSSSSSSS